MKMDVKTQKSSDKLWVDETGQQIPYKRTTKAERLMERNSARILKESIQVNSRLRKLKAMLETLSMEVFNSFMAEKNSTRKTKGNFTWYNFDRSIKIEININEPIKFDELTITAAKDKFDEFLKNNITSENEFIKKMVMDAFETKRTAQLDTKRVLSLIRYESKINNTLFSEAVRLINEAIRRPKTKTYYRVWAKINGEYQNIELNLSSL